MLAYGRQKRIVDAMMMVRNRGRLIGGGGGGGSGGCMNSSRQASTAAAGAGPPRIVISRRAWEAHKRTMPAQPKTKKSTKDSTADKPWPRSVLLAGYGAASTIVPYCIIWYIVADPKYRDYFGDYLPLEMLRSHFGEVEWDAMSYVDDLDRQEAKLPMDANYSQYPGEFTYRTRKQQDKIKQMDERDLNAKLYVVLNATSQQEQPPTKVPGSTKATTEALRNYISGSGSIISGNDDASSRPPVAVEFQDDDIEGDSDGSSEFGQGGLDGISLSSSSSSPTENSATTNKEYPIVSLLKKTGTYSSWFYQPGQESGSNGNGGNNTESTATITPKSFSESEMEISRLEYTIEQLTKNLKDPTCTRDMDDMRNELNQAKRDLSKLKWKRRLGF